jgi:CspA family cold shock protein
MSADVSEARPVRGRVKWFDPAKGYGFVISEEIGPDILLHANVLRNFGQGSISEGVEVSLTVQQTDRGVQAVEVLEITVPLTTTEHPEQWPEEFSAQDLTEQELQPGRVKWFDKAKGFGFANVFGDSDDVFIHVDVLRRSGFADLQSGEAVGLKIIKGRRGRMAIQVAAWEAALRKRED